MRNAECGMRMSYNQREHRDHREKQGGLKFRKRGLDR
jgi:hypothetical protein